MNQTYEQMILTGEETLKGLDVPLIFPLAKAGALPPGLASGICKLYLKEYDTYFWKRSFPTEKQNICARAGGAQRVSQQPCRATGHRPVAPSNEQTVVRPPWGHPPLQSCLKFLGSN